MRIKLDSRWTEKLKALPESGMGYQLVDVKTSDGRELRRVIALNAEWLEVPDEFQRAEIVEIRLCQK